MAPFLIRLKHACAALTGRFSHAQLLEFEIMADATDIANAAAALSAKVNAYVSQSQANYTALQAATVAASAAADQAVAAINGAASAVPDVTTIGGTDPAPLATGV